MKKLLLAMWMTCFLGPLSFGAGVEKQYGLLTPSYGIVTEDDLAFDAQRYVMRPYDPADAIGPARWQCFPAKDAIATYRSWRGPDPRGAWNEILDLCFLEIRVHHNGEWQLFSDHRAHEADYCKDVVRDWHRLIRGEPVVCL